jgi:hypothetical protein
LRTLTELTTEMTKAGLDPSRIQERAEMLAKIQGAKRKRNADDEEEDVEMDNDDDGSGSDNGMDVDNDGSAPTKRVKTNSGGVINKREPRSNRQTAGLRDEGVGFFDCPYVLTIHLEFSSSNSLAQSSFAILVNVLAICLRKQEKEIVLSKPKWLEFLS